jgi:exopolysaccharide biosynthesis protein
MKKKLYPGVIYRREVRYAPHMMIIHILALDRREKKIDLFVTPPDQRQGPPLLARTTSQFLDEYDVQLAVNGDGFSPWWSRSPVDYYPHAGDPVTPNGFAASRGKIYSRGEVLPPEPTLYVSRGGVISFNRIPSRIRHAISGDRMLVLKGEPVEGLDDEVRHPRTAIGMSFNGRWLYLVVIDGRQPLYSEGATLQELAEILADLGAQYAMNLDGGGSSTMVIAGEDGMPILLNSPIDNYIPGRERPVANHIGIFIKE